MIRYNPKKKWRAQYVRKSRERGGHEEGGWYYDEITTAGRKSFKRPGAAAAYAKRMHRKYGTPVGEWSGRWDDQEQIQHGRRDRLLKESGRPQYNPRHRNPKRDGSATRHEKRMTKYADYLRQISKRGQDAHSELLRLLGRDGAKAGPDVVHAEPVLKAPKTATQEAHPPHYATETTASEEGYVKQRIHEVNLLMEDVQDQMKGLGDADEGLMDELTTQLTKLSKQRKMLKEKLESLMVKTNPRRRRYGRRMNPARARRYKQALLRFRDALIDLRHRRSRR